MMCDPNSLLLRRNNNRFVITEIHQFGNPSCMLIVESVAIDWLCSVETGRMLTDRAGDVTEAIAKPCDTSVGKWGYPDFMLVADWFMEKLSFEKHYVSKQALGGFEMPTQEYAIPLVSKSIGFL